MRIVEFITRIRLHQALAQLSVSEFIQTLGHRRRKKFYYRKFAYTYSMRVVKRCRTDSVCHYLQRAVLCYNVGNHRQCIDLIQRATDAMSSPITMSSCRFLCLYDGRLERMLRADRRPVDTLMNKSFIGVFIANALWIHELYIEANGRSLRYIHCMYRMMFIYLCSYLPFFCSICATHILTSDMNVMKFYMNCVSL